MSYKAGAWLIDECQIAFFMSCLMLRVCTHLFCRYFQCHLSYHQQFVWYPGYHGYQFYAPLALIYIKYQMKRHQKTLFKTGVHKTGIRGIQDTRQIADGKTNDIEITTKKVGTNS